MAVCFQRASVPSLAAGGLCGLYMSGVLLFRRRRRPGAFLSGVAATELGVKRGGGSAGWFLCTAVVLSFGGLFFCVYCFFLCNL